MGNVPSRSLQSLNYCGRERKGTACSLVSVRQSPALSAKKLHVARGPQPQTPIICKCCWHTRHISQFLYATPNENTPSCLLFNIDRPHWTLCSVLANSLVSIEYRGNNLNCSVPVRIYQIHSKLPPHPFASDCRSQGLPPTTKMGEGLGNKVVAACILRHNEAVPMRGAVRQICSMVD